MTAATRLLKREFFVRLMLEGAELSAIAEKIDVPLRTVKQWPKQTWYAPLKASIEARPDVEVLDGDEFTEAVAKAAGRLVGLVNSQMERFEVDPDLVTSKALADLGNTLGAAQRVRRVATGTEHTERKELATLKQQNQTPVMDFAMLYNMLTSGQLSQIRQASGVEVDEPKSFDVLPD